MQGQRIQHTPVENRPGCFDGLLTVLRKEYLTQRRQMRIWWRLLLRIAFILACFVWLTAVVIRVIFERERYGYDGSEASVALVFVVLFAIAQVLPSTSGSIAREREQGTLDMLLLTRLRSSEILAGKWLAASIPPSIIIVLSMIAVTIPLALMGEPSAELWLYVFSVMQAVLFSGMLAIYVSTLAYSFARSIGIAIGILSVQYVLPSLTFFVLSISGYPWWHYESLDSIFILSALITILLSSLIIALGITSAVGDGITTLTHWQSPPLFKTFSIILGTVAFFMLEYFIFRGMIETSAEVRRSWRYLWETIVTMLNCYILYRLAIRQVDRLRGKA